MWPFWLVLAMPCVMAYAFARAAGEAYNGFCLCYIVFGIVGFVVGLICNICFIPIAVLGTIVLVLVRIIQLLSWCCKGCK